MRGPAGNNNRPQEGNDRNLPVTIFAIAVLLALFLLVAFLANWESRNKLRKLAPAEQKDSVKPRRRIAQG